MSKPRRILDFRPKALGPEVEPVQGIKHPAAGEIGMWLDKALEGVPSSGAVGEEELRRHWARLPADKRKLLLLLAREMRQDDNQA